MRTSLRVLAALNAAFQGLVGLAAVLAPTAAAAAFGLPADLAPAAVAVIRMFGGLLAGAGMFAALVAMDPDRPAGFRRTLAAALFLNVAADLVVVGAGELALGQVAVGMGLELVFGVALLLPTSGAAARG